ncbi:hypothetical protein HN011_006479 [Eciton burchellii]|nr:hypothetical protein HN011_006479 [Eciton burchellii]
MSDQYALDYFDTNRLETYEEISNERNDIFANLTFRFACKGMPPGFYADIDYNCRIFHVCDNFGGGFPVLCANYTGFDQRQRICTDQEDIDCQHAHEWYYLNELIYFTEIESKAVTEEMMKENESKMEEEDTVPSVLPLSVD